MRRLVEFDLVTKSEPNTRFASQAGMFAKAARTKAQREAVRAVLRSSFGSPPPLHVVQVGERYEPVGAVGMAVRNTIAVTLTRIAPGLLDAFENLPAALKAIVDEVAAWCGPKDNDPIYTWKAEQRKSERGIYRVELLIVDKLTGADRVVRLAETRSAGVQASARVKRAVKKASVRDLHAAAERLLSPLDRLKDEAARRGRSLTASEGFAMLRDPGEERSARQIADCTTCGAKIGQGCKLDFVPPQYRESGRWQVRIIFGVHEARARAAGLHVLDDDRAKVKPARAARGARKLVPAARPAGQTVLPMLRAFAALPWENPPCSVCGGSGNRPNLGPRGPLAETCGGCNGTRRAKGRVLTRAARYDGLDDPPTTITASVPAEHAQRYGSTVTLTRQKFDSRATGPCWVYATNDERTTT